MPTISRFFGIVIRMYFADHAPPHFHAIYGDDEAIFEIQTLEILAGGMPRRAKALVLEWALEHRPELLENWERAQANRPLRAIEPLV